MTADFSKILEHPNCDEIISKLTHGVQPKDISDWLKIKYSEKEQTHLRLSTKILKDFLEGHLDLYKDIEQDILAAKTGQKIQKVVSASLKNNKTYQERIQEVAEELGNNEIDIYRYLGEMCVIGKARIEQVFDKIQQNPESFKPDYAIIKWIETMANVIEKYDKMVNNRPDQIIQHNVTVNVLDQYVASMQDAVRETLAEIDPEAAFMFIERFGEKVQGMDLPEELRSIPQEKRLEEVKILHEKVSKKNDDDDEDD